MNDEIVEKFDTQTLTKGSAFLKVLYYKLSEWIFQHLWVRQKNRRTERSRMRNGYIREILASLDMKGTFILGGKVIKIHEGVI